MREFSDTIPVQPLLYPRRPPPAACRGDACQQGRRPCPTPEACFLPDEPTGPHDDGGLVMLGRLLVVFVVVAALAAMFWPA
jgi:hypothetical protein